MNHGNVEHKLVAIILGVVGSLLLPWGVRWLAILGAVIGTLGVVVAFFGPLIWFLAEIAAHAAKRVCRRESPEENRPDENDV
jgi:hypothetical protein